MSDKAITSIDPTLVIRVNRELVEERILRDPSGPEHFGLSQDRLDEVMSIFYKSGADLLGEAQIIEKAAYFLGALSWAQPFDAANKSTGMIVMVLFMRKNGLDLKTSPLDEAYLRGLLYEIQEERTELNREVMGKIILYIQENTIKYDSQNE